METIKIKSQRQISDSFKRTLSKRQMMELFGVKDVREYANVKEFKDFVKKVGSGEGKFIGYTTGGPVDQYDFMLVFEKAVKHVVVGKDKTFQVYRDGMLHKG